MCAQQVEQIQRAIDGDLVELTLLLRESRRRLCALVGGKVPADLRRLIDADDVVQDAQVEAFRHIGELEVRSEDSFDRWLATIAVRKLRDSIKRLRAVKRGGGQPRVHDTDALQESAIALFNLVTGSEGSPSRTVARAEAVQVIESALADLPAHYRHAVQLVYMEGCPVAVAAVEMCCTERAVHGRCRRALDLLRDRLGSGSRIISALE